MAFTTSTELFDNAFTEPEADPALLEEFLDEVVSYLDSMDEYEEAVSLADWIRSGQPIHGFVCRYDLVEDMSKNMLHERVPFVAVTEKRGNIAYVVRSCDDETIEQIRQQVIDEHSRYFIETSLKEMAEALLKARDSEKDMLTIGGLSEDQADVLKMILDDNLEGDMVGVDEHVKDGKKTYSFTFQAKKAMKKGYRDSIKLTEIAVTMMMQSKGFMKEANIRNARNKENFQKALAGRFRQNGKHGPETWVIGKGPRYLRIGDEGFEYGTVVNDENGISYEELYSADISVPDYTEQLVSYASSIPEVTFTTDAKQAMLHLSGKGDGTLVFNKSFENKMNDYDGKLYADMEKDVIRKTIEMVEEKTRADPVMTGNGNWDAKLKLTMREAAAVLECAQFAVGNWNEVQEENEKNGIERENDVRDYIKEVPKGYPKKGIEELTEILAKDYGLTLNNYTEAISAMRHMEVYLDKAEPERASSLEGLVENTKGRRDEDRSHDGRSSGPSKGRSSGPRRD